MRCLVTGVAGFIGSHLADRLIQDGHTVVGIDNMSTGKMKWVNPRVEFRWIDIRENFWSVIGTVDVVFHNAALGSVPRSFEDPQATFKNNVDGFLSVLDGARQTKTPVVYASSSSVMYGVNHPYGLSKKVNEMYADQYAQWYDLPSCGLRYFNVFGPRQNWDSDFAAVIPKWIVAAFKRQPLYVHGSGQQTRDFTYIDNVVDANIAAAKEILSPDRRWACCTRPVSCAKATSIAELSQMIMSMTDSTSEIVYKPKRKGDIERSIGHPNSEHKGSIQVEEGLQRTIAWYKKELNF